MFMRDKLIKFGYKFWCLCNSNGYLFNFDPNFGKGESDGKEPLGMGVVKKLTEVVPSSKEQSYQIFFDNFFTSFETLVLLQKKISKQQELFKKIDVRNAL